MEIIELYYKCENKQKPKTNQATNSKLTGWVQYKKGDDKENELDRVQDFTQAERKQTGGEKK